MTTAAGAFARKSHRHDPWATTHPPATGPTAPTTDPSADQVPMAAPRAASSV
jgi:hypothetical protein